MHQTTITRQQFADLYEDLQVVGAIRTGLFWVITAFHPCLGDCVFIEDCDEAVVLRSWFPFRARRRALDAGADELLADMMTLLDDELAGLAPEH